MKMKDGGNMRRRATMSPNGHGQTLAGRLRVLISTGSKQGWFEYDCEGQRAAGVAVPNAGRVGRVVTGCFR